jgi:hypothetical protein
MITDAITHVLTHLAQLPKKTAQMRQLTPGEHTNELPMPSPLRYGVYSDCRLRGRPHYRDP